MISLTCQTPILKQPASVRYVYTSLSIVRCIINAISLRLHTPAIWRLVLSAAPTAGQACARVIYPWMSGMEAGSGCYDIEMRTGIELDSPNSPPEHQELQMQRHRVDDGSVESRISFLRNRSRNTSQLVSYTINHQQASCADRPPYRQQHYNHLPEARLVVRKCFELGVQIER